MRTVRANVIYLCCIALKSAQPGCQYYAYKRLPCHMKGEELFKHVLYVYVLPVKFCTLL